MVAVFDGSITLGGKVTQNQLVFRSGPNLNASILYKKNPQFQYGGGFGYLGLEDETFIPLFLQMRVKLRPKPSGFYFGLRSGYSIGISPKALQVEGSSFQGGWMIQPTFGYITPISQRAKFQFGLQMLYQQGLLKRSKGTIQTNYTERLRFTMVGIMCGFTF